MRMPTAACLDFRQGWVTLRGNAGCIIAETAQERGGVTESARERGRARERESGRAGERERRKKNKTNKKKKKYIYIYV